MMMKFFWSVFEAAVAPVDADGSAVFDMLRHPDIRRMSERELSDLPLPRGRNTASSATAACR